MEYTASEKLVRLFDFGMLHMEANTVVFIFILLLVVMFFMNRFLFSPVLRTLDARAGALETMRTQVENGKKEIAQLSENYQASLEKVRAEVGEVRAESRKEAAQQVEEILKKARSQADQTLKAALSELEKEVAQASTELSQAAQGLAQKTADRILS